MQGKKKRLPAEKQLPHLKRLLQRQRITTEIDTTRKNYIGLSEGTFKQCYTQNKLSFRNRNCSNGTELSKHNWTLKDNNTNFAINQLTGVF